MNKNKNCAQEIRLVKVPQLALPPSGTSNNWHFPQLALPLTGPRPRLKSPNCRYAIPNLELRAEKLRGAKVDENVHACCVANFFAPLCIADTVSVNQRYENTNNINVWFSDIPPSGFNKNNKEPLELLGKIESRYKKFITEFISNKPKVIKAVSDRVAGMTDRMEKLYKKLNRKCDFYETSSKDDTER